MTVTKSALAKESTFERFKLIAVVSDLPGSGFCGDGSQDLGPLPRPQTARGAWEPPEVASKGSGPLLPPHFSFDVQPSLSGPGHLPLCRKPQELLQPLCSCAQSQTFPLRCDKRTYPTHMSCHIFGLWLLHLGQLTVSDRKMKKTRGLTKKSGDRQAWTGLLCEGPRPLLSCYFAQHSFCSQGVSWSKVAAEAPAIVPMIWPSCKRQG